MKKSRILELNQLYSDNKLKPIDVYNESLNKLQKLLNLNISLKQVEFKYDNKTDSLLDGIVYSLKDNIATKGIITTGGSLFLKNYIPEYDASVKEMLDKQNAILISKDNLDEFGLGGTGTFSGYGHVFNPLDKNRITGGSSSGSAVMVQQEISTFAIATDTGDSIRKPASFLGIYGYKPTYGLISRYGVYPYAPSLDHVGVLANSIDDIAIVLSYIVKKDNKDYSSISIDNNEFFSNLKPNKNAKLVVLNETIQYMKEKEQEAFKQYLNKLSKTFDIKYINFGIDLLKLIDPIYKALSYSEASTCYANLNGILFGECEEGNNFEEISIKSRTKYFGKQLKRRFIIGSYATLHINFNDVYLKAKQIRTLLMERTNKILNEYDAIIMPGASRIAPTIKELENNEEVSNICDDALQIANFAGLPSLTIPAINIDNLPLGINITSKQKNDQLVLNIAKAIEESENN